MVKKDKTLPFFYGTSGTRELQEALRDGRFKLETNEDEDVDVNLSDEGDFLVDFIVEIYENDSKTKAGKSGLGLFVKSRSSRLILNGQPSDKVEGRIYIPAGKSGTGFSIVLSNALRDKISVNLVHPRGKETIKQIWCTVIWRFFIWAFIGGLIGGLIKFVGTQDHTQTGFKPRLVKAVIDIFFGILVGGVLLIILLLLPNLVGQLPAVAPLVNGAAGK